MHASRGVFVLQWCASEGLSLTGSSPCLGCPFVDSCFVGGPRDPRDCEYLSTWLHLENKVGGPNSEALRCCSASRGSLSKLLLLLHSPPRCASQVGAPPEGAEAS